jgi:hypothetical protein
MSKFITKSDILRAKQCLKQAYLAHFKPKLATPMDPYQQLLIDRGHKVGAIAREQVAKTYPAKLLFEKGNQDHDGLTKTKLALKDSRLSAYFEPSFSKDDLFVRCDILIKNSDGTFDLIEVKSGSDMDDEYILDAAIQNWVLTQTGVKIRKTLVWYINKQCALPDLSNLFIKADVSDDIAAYFGEIQTIVQNLRSVFAKAKITPPEEIGPHCNKPFACPFSNFCHKEERNIPELSVFNIPRIGQKAFDLFEQGIVNIEDIDTSKFKFTENQLRMIEHTQSKKMFLNKEAIKAKLDKWVFPLYLIDFEAMDYDLPGFANTRPGIHIAFQLSVKKLESPEGDIKEVGHYLHTDNSDPRVALGKFMLETIGDTGSIVAYSQAFEKGKILDIASLFTGLEKMQLESLPPRLVDPLPIFRESVYHHEFHGSYSIKKVGPALLGEKASYKNLNVKDGTEAVVAFRRMISSQNFEEKQQLIKDLTIYCDQDTEVMGLLVKWLYQNCQTKVAA